MEKNIEVFTSPTCPYCVALKDFLTENNIEYKERNITEDEKAREELVEKSGQMHIPVTFIDDKVIVGFDEDELKKELNIS